MRMLFATTPATGHVQPVLGLALAAREAGHTVAWATAADALPQLRTHGLSGFEVGSPWEAVRQRYRDQWLRGTPLAPREASSFTFPHLFGEVAAHDRLAGLSATVADWAPDLVVHEIGCLAAPLASRLQGVPHVSHAFGLPLPRGVLEAANAKLAPTWVAHGLPPPVLCGLFDHGAIELAPRSLRDASGLQSLAQQVWSQAPASVSAAPGAVLPASLAHFVEAAAREGRPLVYLTFGTVFQATAAFESALAAARQLRVAVVATTGSPAVTAALRAAADRAGPAPLWLDDYVPQSLLLPHCAAVVSHGGSGTAFGAAAQGRPQLFIPQGADQFRNADAFVAAGAGLLLEGQRVLPPSIAEALSRLLDDAAFEAAARRLQRELAAMPTPADTVRSLAQHFGAPRV